MGKVTFEYDEDADRAQINNIINLPTFLSSLYDLQKLYRNIYKHYTPSDATIIAINDGKYLSEEEIRDYVDNNGPIENSTTYIKQSYIEQELGYILESVSNLLD